MNNAHLTQFRDRLPRPVKPTDSGDQGTDDGPRRPKVERPNTNDVLKRMRKVDPDQARRYRQRTGE
ncbi:MAG: ubiquitin-like protein UBact [Candidatus Latescibacteria bacterium]|nr:ubiquitin-like protein UBact [Candidatus Latescibacterota bacterium]